MRVARHCWLYCLTIEPSDRPFRAQVVVQCAPGRDWETVPPAVAAYARDWRAGLALGAYPVTVEACTPVQLYRDGTRKAGYALVVGTVQP